jgi:hypothetical protein
MTHQSMICVIWQKQLPPELFRPGEVVFVTSNQAAGYRARDKYHVCICGYRGRYLFINSKTWEGAFTLSHADFPALPNAESYIACNKLLHVSDQYMREHNAQSVGHLPRQVVAALIEHIEHCEVMTEEEKEIAIDGLSGAL